MSSDPSGRWPDSDMPPNPNPLPPPLPGAGNAPDGKGLKGMLADAMAKSRGVGDSELIREWVLQRLHAT